MYTSPSARRTVPPSAAGAIIGPLVLCVAINPTGKPWVTFKIIAAGLEPTRPRFTFYMSPLPTGPRASPMGFHRRNFVSEITPLKGPKKRLSQAPKRGARPRGPGPIPSVQTSKIYSNIMTSNIEPRLRRYSSAF